MFIIFDVQKFLTNFIETDYCNDIEDCTCKHPYCYNFFEKVFGVKIFTEMPVSKDPWCFNPDGYRKFSFINPVFFDSLKNNMFVNPTERIKNISYQQLYNVLFKNIIDNYYDAYILLLEKDSILNIEKKYKNFIDKNEPYLDLFLFHEYMENAFDSINYAYNENYTDYNSSIKFIDYNKSPINTFKTTIIINNKAITVDDYSKIVSFWLRRKIDGSSSSIFNTIKYYKVKYDL